MYIFFQCHNCGSDLKILPEHFSSFKCSNCNTSFEFDKEKSSMKSITTVDNYRKYKLKKSKLRTILDGGLNKLDSEWLLEQETYKVYSKDGSRVLPNKIAIITYIIGAFISAIFMVLWTSITNAQNSFTVFGIMSCIAFLTFTFLAIFNILSCKIENASINKFQ